VNAVRAGQASPTAASLPASAPVRYDMRPIAAGDDAAPGIPSFTTSPPTGAPFSHCARPLTPAITRHFRSADIHTRNALHAAEEDAFLRTAMRNYAQLVRSLAGLNLGFHAKWKLAPSTPDGH